MKILVISNYYPPVEIGGWEQLTRDVVDELGRRGHVVRVLTGNWGAGRVAGPEPLVARELFLQSSDPFHYRARSSLLAGYGDWRNRGVLSGWLAGFRPDVVFIGGLWNLSPRLAAAAEEMAPGRVVYYMASPWPVEADVHAVFWDDPAGRLWRRWPKKWLGAIVRRLFLRPFPAKQLAFERVLCVSRYIQEMMIAEVGVARANTAVVHNGIEPELFRRKEWGIGGRGLRLLYAGQIRADKGLHTAIEALAQILPRYPDLSLTVVGGGSPGYIDQMKGRVAQLGLESVVTFRQQVGREVMPAIFGEHDVLLFPSIWPEPLARVVQEAMACGLVVVGTRTGGTPELLEEGYNGLTFEAGDVAGLADRLGELAMNPNLAATLSANAYQTVLNHFTLGRMVDQLERHCDFMIGGGF